MITIKKKRRWFENNIKKKKYRCANLRIVNRHFTEMRISKGQKNEKLILEDKYYIAVHLQTFELLLKLKWTEKFVSKAFAETLGRNTCNMRIIMIE